MNVSVIDGHGHYVYAGVMPTHYPGVPDKKVKPYTTVEK